jgi:hypothetical protein
MDSAPGHVSHNAVERHGQCLVKGLPSSQRPVCLILLDLEACCQHQPQNVVCHHGDLRRNYSRKCNFSTIVSAISMIVLPRRRMAPVSWVTQERCQYHDWSRIGRVCKDFCVNGVPLLDGEITSWFSSCLCGFQRSRQIGTCNRPSSSPTALRNRIRFAPFFLE